VINKAISLLKFQETVWEYYRSFGRHTLLWRKTRNSYRILVSEVMLQQTQVDRVIPKYREFLKAFPTVKALAQASLSDALRLWSGLGYNRRAMHLKRAAEVIVEGHAGRMPRTVEALEALPGIGPYTARAVATFAYDEPTILIETNIRTVFLHHFFKDAVSPIADRDILPLIEAVLDRDHPREWYYALMDYGAYLKKAVGNVNRASKHYARQSRFEGSRRQARGSILRMLLDGPKTKKELQTSLNRPIEQVLEFLKILAVEGYIIEKKGRYSLR
jgi:A/G-specific adenine glycosylase